jgi:heat-inducible transcriptional repressor
MTDTVSASTNSELNERARALLKNLVERYISDGQPVGSKTLAEDYSQSTGKGLSPATIRNVMGDLEGAGLIASPHTSAGRIPTQQGLRFFVDSLLKVEPLEGAALNLLQTQLQQGDLDSSNIVEVASGMLSEITHMAGLVTVPKQEFSALRQIEFLPLSDRRVLAVLVTNDHDVQNRVIDVEREYGRDELQQLAGYLNAHLSGLSMSEVRRRLLAEMTTARETMNNMMADAVGMAEKALAAGDANDAASRVVVAGQTNLFGFEEFCEVGKLRGLLDAFNQKRELLGFLDRCENASGIQIFIGHESGYQPLDECSVIATPYGNQDDIIGVLGVVGPTRMAYDKVIPVVDATARLLGAALTK